MVDQYIGEIRMFAGLRSEAPVNWAFCDGSVLNISDNPALYALLGIIYGGNGITTFALPDYRSRLPIGIGLENGHTYGLGENGGLEQITLTPANMPGHTHPWVVSTNNGTVTTASGNVYGAVPNTTIGGKAVGGLYQDVTTSGFALYAMDPTVIGSAGVSPAIHENRMPGMAISFIIALNGVYPVRS